MKFNFLFPFALSAILVSLAGCVAEPASSSPQETTKFTVASTDKFELLDKPAQIYVSCTGLQEQTTPGGRLEVVANLRNRENRPLEVQVSCVFKDAAGFSIGEESPMQAITLEANATEIVRFIATSALAKKYTIRLREAR